jgi:hypothetical protein
MKNSVVRFIAAAALGVFMALAVEPASAKTAKECNDEYAANKVAIQAAKEKKADFIAACRAAPEGQATPIGAAATTAAPSQSTSHTTSTASTTRANEFTTEAQAKSKCPASTVVWVNLKSKIYHFAGSHDYGNTKEGAYMCETDATAAGDRAAKNEKHP